MCYTLSTARPSPTAVASFLSGFPSLTHASIIQDDNECDETTQHTAEASSLPRPGTHRRDVPSAAPSYWVATLASLQSRHLRTLELEGLPLQLHPYRPLTAASLQQLALSEAGAARPKGAPAASEDDVPWLLSRLLRQAGLLQELSLSLITIAPPEPTRTQGEATSALAASLRASRSTWAAARAGPRSTSCSSSSSSAGSSPCGSPRRGSCPGDGPCSPYPPSSPPSSRSSLDLTALASPGHSPGPSSPRHTAGLTGHRPTAPYGTLSYDTDPWDLILGSLPPSLTALRLTLRTREGTACPPGSCSTRSASSAAHSSCPCPCAHPTTPRPSTLAAALRRLPHLQTLELSGLPAEDAVAALSMAAAATSESPLDPPGPGPVCRGPISSAAAVPARGLTGLPAATLLPGLTRLVLDVQGPLDLAALRGLLQGGACAPQLQHLTLVEQQEQEQQLAAVDMSAPGGGRDVGSDARGESHRPVEPAPAYEPLGSVLWMLRLPHLQRLAVTLSRTLTTLVPYSKNIGPCSSTTTTGGGSGGGGSNLRHVRLCVDLSAEALEPLVCALPPSTTHLLLHVGALRRPVDTLQHFTHHHQLLQHRLQGRYRQWDAEWMSTPPDSFLGGVRFVWPALTRLPALVPHLSELRLGGCAAACCSDHVLRCWAAASRLPDALSTPMVTDPAYNALIRGTAEDEGGNGEGEQQGAEGMELGGRGGVECEDPLLGRGRRVEVGEEGEELEVAWSDWVRTLQVVALTAPGPTVAGALHLRRFSPALRRLQVVVERRLVEVVVAGQGGR